MSFPDFDFDFDFDGTSFFLGMLTGTVITGAMLLALVLLLVKT